MRETLDLLKSVVETLAWLFIVAQLAAMLYIQTDAGSQKFVECVNEGSPSVFCAVNKWLDKYEDSHS